MKTGSPRFRKYSSISPSLQRWLSLICAVGLLGGLCGCDDASAKAKALVYSVSGSLTINGKPGTDVCKFRNEAAVPASAFGYEGHSVGDRARSVRDGICQSFGRAWQ